MWVGHYGTGFIAKPLAPRVPLKVLAFASVLPDVVFFLLQFVGIESFNLDKELAKRGCFPYSNDYPFSHSLAGMVVSGIALAALYGFTSRRQLTIWEYSVIVATSASHFLLEWPSHRGDVKLTPGDAHELGAGLFDRPISNFFLECIIFYAGMKAYMTFSPVYTRRGYLNGKESRVWTVLGVMLIQQAHFCFGSAPTAEAKWVHAPLFLFEILASCWLIGQLEDF